MTQVPRNSESSPNPDPTAGPSGWGWLKPIAPLVVGLLLLGIVLATSDLGGIVAALRKTRWHWYLLAQVTMISYIGLHVWRWHYLLRMQGIDYSFPQVFLIYNAGALAGAVTPVRLGDFARLVYFIQDGHSIISVTLSIILDRFLDLIILGLVALAAVGYLPLPQLLRHGLLALAAAGLLLGMGAGLFAWRTWNWDRLHSLLLRILPLKLRPKVGPGIGGLQKALERFLSWRLHWPFFLTFIIWGVNFLAAYLIAQSIGLPLNFWQIGACLSLTAFVTLIPITVAGIGTRELSLIFLFSLLGIKQEQALAFSLLILSLVVTHALIGWFSLILQPPWGEKFAHRVN